MTTIELATTTVIGTALILAPIDPQPIRDLNTPPAEPTPEPEPAEPATVATYDNHGSLWGYDTITRAAAVIAEAYANGSDITEWHITALDGQPYRIVRIADPTFLDDICVIPA